MIHKILFVVAHPDDESLWIGGLLDFLNRREEVEIYVLCVTGRNHSERYKEFESVMNIVGIKNWYVGNEDIPLRGGVFLSELDKSFNDGLSSLRLKLEDIDVLITHPFYGDEHLHCQHSQMFEVLSYFCHNNDIPFGFFSTIIIRYYRMSPLLTHMKRDGGVHLINYSYCESHSDVNDKVQPEYFYQFKIDSKVKAKMLSCYQSINQEEHQNGYASWDSDVEGVYFMNAKAAKSFSAICSQMDAPAGNAIFANKELL